MYDIEDESGYGCCGDDYCSGLCEPEETDPAKCSDPSCESCRADDE